MYIINYFAILGYFLSVIFDKKMVALASTVFSLLWALVLSGIIPDLADLDSDNSIIKAAKIFWK